MSVFFLLLTFLSCYRIIKTSGAKRALWFIGSVLFLSDSIVLWGPFNSHFAFVLSFLISLCFHHELKTCYKEYPLRKISIIIFIIYLLIGVVDTRIPIISRFSRPVTGFFLTYMVFFIGFCCVKSKNDLHVILSGFVKMLAIVCVYGLLTFVIQSNPIYDLISNSFTGDLGIWANVQERGYRVCSFLSNPIVFGGVMGVYSLIILNTWQTNNKVFKYIVLALLLLSVLIANSRTSIFSTLVAYILYYLLKNKLSYKNVLAAFSAVIIILIMYNQLSFIRPMIDSAIDLVMTGGENTQGSTTDLKEQQWEVSLLSFYDAPFFGHGLSYFNEVMGNKDSFIYDPLIAGMEGYQYKLLIEQGGFMIIAVIIFYVQLFTFFLKKRKHNQTVSYVGTACTVSFLFFICATGVYGSAFLHFGIYIGILLRCVYDKRIFSTYPSIQCREIY
ncbi:O-antigen ligase family protein [Marseilla massiliensis]|uniref:O-antigen ligase family protein n=1 Tax=Marseilla massiliensis TaxID=1841864 RepID=A0A938WPD2_9BACT|nr:O-antigen ligase family protein [Marseilla massiliensis]MBM6662929.1 O-antigen ligase family protein [Marseilla massiliensis]